MTDRAVPSSIGIRYADIGGTPQAVLTSKISDIAVAEVANMIVCFVIMNSSFQLLFNLLGFYHEEPLI